MTPVPSKRFVLFASLLLPLGLSGLVSSELEFMIFWGMGVLASLAIVDLYLSPNVLKNLRIEVEPVTRFARGCSGNIRLHLYHDRSAPKVLNLGLSLPVEFIQERDVQTVMLTGKEEAKHWVVERKVIARARGVYYCPFIYAEASSLLGLFQVRRRYPTTAELRVYPNLRRERSQLANLFLNRGDIGVHAQRMIGQGREYEQLREYGAGDSMLDIHWKASAKRGELVTKTYQVERTQEIYLVIDHSRLSGLHSKRSEEGIDDEYAETALERYVTAASVLGMVADREGDLFGLVAFGKRVSRFVRAGSGRQHGQVIQNALFDLKTERTPFDLDELFTFIRTYLRRRALIIIMTDLSDAAAADEFKQHVAMLASQHYLLVNSIRREEAYPMYATEQTEGRAKISDQIAGHLRWSGLQQLKTELHAVGVEFSVIDNEKLSLQLINQYFAIKQRQVL